MRLFYADKAECDHISNITRRVQKIYQLEVELHPYLTVEFLPNKSNENPHIVIEANREIIKKDIDLDNKTEFIKLRELLWDLLRKNHYVKDITYPDTKLPCIKDFRDTQTNNVIQGWQTKKRLMMDDICCKQVKNIIANGLMEFLILHPVYRYSNNDIIDENICKKLRYQECSDNYYKYSPTWERCVKEVKWLCENGYKKNNIVDRKNKFVAKVIKNIYKYLDENNLKVDKKMFDHIITSGLFDDVGNRMGNKSINIDNVSDALDKVMWEKGHYLKMIEGFGEDNTNDLESVKLSMRGSSLTKYLVIIILIFLILIALII